MIQGFKNIIKSTSFLDQSFQQLLKKTDESRKIAKMSLEHLNHIHRFLDSFSITFQKLLLQYNQITQEGNPFNHQIYSRLEKVFVVQHECTKKLNGSIKQTVEKSNDVFNDYSNLIISFQVAIRNYINHLQMMTQSSKRYFKNHKSLINNLQQYKLSFTDVKLIYNTDQRIKRYNTCELNYKTLLQQLKNIQSKLPLLNQFKKEVISNYKNISFQFISALKFVGNRIITLSQLFVFQLNNMFKGFTSLLQQRPFVQSKFTFAIDKNSYEQFMVDDYNKQTKQNANYVIYLFSIKPQFHSQMAKIHTSIIKDICDKMQTRKKTNKHLYEFTSTYFKQLQKIFNAYLKEINSNYQKTRKKISEIYGTQYKFFMKTFSIIFEKIIEQMQILNKSSCIKLKNTENIIQEEYKHIDSFIRELKASSEKIIRKKTLSKNQVEEDSTLEQQFTRLQAYEKSFFMKISQNQSQLSINYNGILNDLLAYSQSLFQFCSKFHKQELDQVNFLKRYKQFQIQVDQIMKSKTAFFTQISFGNLLLDNNEDITFEPELNKVEEFKKIKKPVQYQSQKNGEIVRKGSLQEQDIEAPRKQNKAQQVKIVSKQQNMGRNEQFLQSKIVFEEGQKLIDTFKCGLSDKIILSGKLYVTNHRICFHSKFNPNNVFFGDTFLHIPKKDIIKVQKRQNAIIFNNSISITTVNGQVFLTSFFSRNEAFDLICQTFEINNNEDLMFEPSSQHIGFNNHIKEELPEQDDLSQERIPLRAAQIDPMLSQLEYIEVHQSIYTSEGLNALKFFKLFESTQEISYNRKTFKGFNMFIKQLFEHKDIFMEQWSPNINSFLNSTNIKQNTPLKCSKTDRSIIPVPNSGIPLMPKQAQLQEQLAVYFYSKDKYVMQTKIQNFGIPYCQYFNIRYKKVVETIQKNKCRLKLYYYIDFVQKTMMRSVINSKSIEESKLTVGKYENQMKKYLKYLQKIQNRSNKVITRQNQHQQKVKQLQAELQQSKQCEQRLIKEAKSLDQFRKRQRKFLYGSIVLNVLLILVIMSIY